MIWINPDLWQEFAAGGLRFKPMSIMSLLSLQKLLLMLLLQFTADQRKEFFTLLSFCWSKTIRIADGFLARCSLVGLQFWVYKRFNENLALSQLLANTLGLSTHANKSRSLKLPTTSPWTGKWKSFTWEAKPKQTNKPTPHHCQPESVCIEINGKALTDFCGHLISSQVFVVVDDSNSIFQKMRCVE